MQALTAVEGVGPKTVGSLYDALDITTLDELEAAAEAGEIQDIKGFGAKTEQNILDNIEFAREAHARSLLGNAHPYGEQAKRYVGDIDAVETCALGGSLRRWRPTIGDVDVLVGSHDGEAVVDAFTNWPEVEGVIEAGETKASVRAGGLRVDLRVVVPEEFGAALQYFTGSKDHNVVVRNRAIERDLKVNEYGVFREARSASGSRTQSDDADEKAGLIKIYTSGSFLDEREVPAQTRRAIADTFADRDRIVVESLPDFVEDDRVADFVDAGLETDVAVGLETATDRVRHDCVNKYFDFADFEAACEAAREAGAGIKAYLLMKPPFLTESEAVEDMKSSVRRCAAVDGCHTVSMNPCNVQRYTMVEELYHDGGYRPPWLWSVAAVLEDTADEDVIVVSDPVGHGSDRGPHNCGECDDRVQRAIKDFDLRQDPSVFEQVSCECEATYEAVLAREHSYSLPLAR